MLRRSFSIFFMLAAGMVPVQADPFAVNNKKAPESRKDLEIIQKALVSVLEKTRGSTVCIRVMAAAAA